jgi:hypothetical protein
MPVLVQENGGGAILCRGCQIDLVFVISLQRGVGMGGGRPWWYGCGRRTCVRYSCLEKAMDVTRD